MIEEERTLDAIIGAGAWLVRHAVEEVIERHTKEWEAWLDKNYPDPSVVRISLPPGFWDEVDGQIIYHQAFKAADASLFDGGLGDELRRKNLLQQQFNDGNLSGFGQDRNGSNLSGAILGAIGGLASLLGGRSG